MASMGSTLQAAEWGERGAYASALGLQGVAQNVQHVVAPPFER